jgi:hypothetical protein
MAYRDTASHQVEHHVIRNCCFWPITRHNLRCQINPVGFEHSQQLACLVLAHLAVKVFHQQAGVDSPLATLGRSAQFLRKLIACHILGNACRPTWAGEVNLTIPAPAATGRDLQRH